MVLPELLFILEDHNLLFGNKAHSNLILGELSHLPSFPTKAYSCIFFNLSLVMKGKDIILFSVIQDFAS